MPKKTDLEKHLFYWLVETVIFIAIPILYWRRHMFLTAVQIAYFYAIAYFGKYGLAFLGWRKSTIIIQLCLAIAGLILIAVCLFRPEHEYTLCLFLTIVSEVLLFVPNIKKRSSEKRSSIKS